MLHNLCECAAAPGKGDFLATAVASRGCGKSVRGEGAGGAAVIADASPMECAACLPGLPATAALL